MSRVSDTVTLTLFCIPCEISQTPHSWGTETNPGNEYICRQWTSIQYCGETYSHKLAAHNRMGCQTFIISKPAHSEDQLSSVTGIGKLRILTYPVAYYGLSIYSPLYPLTIYPSHYFRLGRNGPYQANRSCRAQAHPCPSISCPNCPPCHP
jgi:hypothetical protein